MSDNSRRLSDFAPPLPEPDTTNLHPVGDIFLGRRLPEFQIRLKGEGSLHPVHIVGRYATCGVHDNQLTQGLAIHATDLVCARFAKEWRLSFQTSLSSLPDALAEVVSRGIARKIRARVIASMASRIQETLKIPVGEIAYYLDSDLTNLWQHWGDDPSRFQGAPQRGCNYTTWTTLLAYEVPQLARPGFVNSSGSLKAFTTNMLKILGGEAKIAIPLWDSVADQVNVYGCETPKYYAQLPLTNDVETLKSVIKHYHRQVIQGGRFGDYQVADPGAPEPALVPESLQPYLGRGLIYSRLPDYQKAQISPAEADRWASQGLIAVAAIQSAQALAQAHCDLSDGYLAWYSQKERAKLTPQQGFGQLAPLTQVQEYINYRGEGLNEYKEVIANLQQAVVPSDWHLQLPLVETPITPEVEAEGVSLP